MSQVNELNPKKLSRRNFLKLGGYSIAGSAAAISLPKALHANSSVPRFETKRSRSKRAFWGKVQEAFVLDPEKVYLNIGTTGSTPRHVLKNYNEYNFLVAKDPWAMGDEWGGWPYVTELIEDIAPQFGANPDELVLSRNTTDGMCSIIGGLNLQKGDEILTTHHEHIAAISPLTIVKERFGLTVKELEIPVFPENEDEFVELFDANVSRKTKLIVFSHITYKTGTRLPAKRICEEVGQRYEIPTLIDGAHAPGMINLDFHDLGCDFYAGSGHKWQCGPGATGFLYMRDNNERLKEYWSDRFPVYWPINGSLYPFAAFMDLATQAQYVGHDNYPAKRALKDVCDYWDRIGRQRIEDYVLSLSAHCKRRIQKVFGDTGTLYSPDVPELSSGLTAFNPFDDPTDSEKIKKFRDRLREEYGFIIRYTNFKINLADEKDTYALRISTHLFHNHRQVEDLVDAMYDLYQDMI